VSAQAPENDPETGLPVGPRVDPAPGSPPTGMTLPGRYVELSPLDPARHGTTLWEGLLDRAHDRLWQYLPDGPFADRAAFDANLQRLCRSENPLFFAILDSDTRRALGWASLMRIKPQHRCVEVGYILYTLPCSAPGGRPRRCTCWLATSSRTSIIAATNGSVTRSTNHPGAPRFG